MSKRYSIYKPFFLIILGAIALSLVILPIYLSTDRVSDSDTGYELNPMHLSPIVNLDFDEIEKTSGRHPSCYIITTPMTAINYGLCQSHWTYMWSFYNYDYYKEYMKDNMHRIISFGGECKTCIPSGVFCSGSISQN